MDEFFAALDKLKAAGLVPLALGGQPWQENITFHAVLLHVGGADLYLKFFRDQRRRNAVASAEFRKVLTTSRACRATSIAGSPGRNWNDATAMLITGKAGFQIMGDWAKGEFLAAGRRPARTSAASRASAPKAPYMIAGDVFVFPKTTDKARDRGAAAAGHGDHLAGHAGGVQQQEGLDPDPPRRRRRASMDVCAQAGVDALKDPSAPDWPTPSMLMTPDIDGAVQPT